MKSLIKPVIKDIVFDWGKTIHDYNLDVHFNWHARLFGIPRHFFWNIYSKYPDGLLFPYECGQSTARFIERFREESAQLCHVLKVAVPKFGNDEFIEHWNMIIDPLPPDPQKLALLRKLNGRGYTLNILSNTNEAHAAYIRGDATNGNRFSRFREVFQTIDRFIASSDPDVQCRKTKPGLASKEECEKIFWRALEISCSRPEETVFIDDFSEYVEVFRGMGGYGIHCTGSWTRIEAELYQLGVRWE